MKCYTIQKLDASNIYFSELLEDEWVLLEIDVPDEKVLLSNFYAWHFIINDWYLGEDNEITIKEESWEYIFNKDVLKQIGYDFEKENLQGTIGRVDCENIKVLKYIINEKK